MKKVEIKLHGVLGKAMGQSVWSLAVCSVSEAIHAINIITANRLNIYLNKHGHDKFEISINGRKFRHNKFLDPNDSKIIEEVSNSELAMKFGNLETIDIIPIVDASDNDIFGIILGALLIIVGVVLTATGVGGILGPALIVGGIGIVAAGVINLLSKPPAFEPFQEIEKGGKKSYLFSGPENTVREGGAVPVGYGRLLVGSQTLSASYDIYNIPITDNIISQIKPGSVLRGYYFGNPGSSEDIGYFRPVPNQGTFHADTADKISLSAVNYKTTSIGALTSIGKQKYLGAILPEGAPREVYTCSVSNNSGFTITLYNVYRVKQTPTDNFNQPLKLRFYFWIEHDLDGGGSIDYTITHPGMNGSPLTETFNIPGPSSNPGFQMIMVETPNLQIDSSGDMTVEFQNNTIVPFINALSLVWADGVADTNTETMMN